MDYTELAFIAKKKKISIESIAKELGYSRQWLHDGLKTFTEDKIMQICKILGITPNEYFGYETEGISNSMIAKNIGGDNTQNSNEAIKALKDQLKEKDKQINRLLAIIERNNLK